MRMTTLKPMLSSSAVILSMYTCRSNYTFKAGNGFEFVVSGAEFCLLPMFCVGVALLFFPSIELY